MFIWTVDPSTERDDLAVPLTESGTGISQVLAILYVVLTSNFPRVFVIDEPQSFLHPGALRKLIGILKRYPEHQYIIATHSPAVITAADPNTISIVRMDDMESRVEALDVSETSSLRMMLAEVGARLSDVFGADSILWVEGRTEELCFPLILEGVAKRSQRGVEIIGVNQTGDFEGRNAKSTFRIYRKLSTGRGLLPPAVGFIFDREGRSKREIQDLKRESKDDRGRPQVYFLARRMYENYLLNPQAIAEVVSEIPNCQR